MRHYTPNKKSQNENRKVLSQKLSTSLKEIYHQTNMKLSKLNSKIIKAKEEPLEEFYNSITKENLIIKKLIEEVENEKNKLISFQKFQEKDFTLLNETKEKILSTNLEKEKENEEKLKKYKEQSLKSHKESNELRQKIYSIVQEYHNELLKKNELKRDYDLYESLNQKIDKEIKEIELKSNKKKEELKNKINIIKEKEKELNLLKIQSESSNEEKRNINNNYQTAKGNIRVFCRVRPKLEKEKNLEMCLFDFSEKNITIYGPHHKSNTGKREENRIKEQYKFDKIFTPNDDQENIFEEIYHMIQSSLDGFNVCIFAYGQTGSGKTYTMEGENNNKRGLIPRALELIFYNINNLEKLGYIFSVNLSCLEIYLDQIRDLLKDNKGKNNNNIINKDDILIKLELKDMNDWIKYYESAKEKRKVAETQCNEKSSRSHCIFQILINCFNKEKNIKREGSLNLIDLAGSERTNKSGVIGDRLKETISINKSLTALKSVINALVAVDNKNSNFVPYKDSVLTNYLQPYLGGDSKTLMFVNISPILNSFNETSCSLRFATDVNSCIIDRDKSEFD
jgi:kinesin family protein C1